MGRGSKKSLSTRVGAMEWPVLFIRDLSLVVICDGRSESENLLAFHPLTKAKQPEFRKCRIQKTKTCKSLRKVLSLGDMEGFNVTDLELPLPDLLEPSEVLTEDHIKELHVLVPNRAKGYPWTRIYSTSVDGFSLLSLYRKMSNFDCPVIIVMQDTDHAVFGALLSHSLRPSDKFYGTGESFLFTFYPSFKEFKWTGENDYFIKGNTDSVSIGASDGHFGLWFDGDLNRGSSNPCLTFSNEVLAGGADFQICTLEAWGFN